MSIWGKLAGAAAGLAIGGPIGALLGGVAGHYVIDRDKEQDGPAENQVAFTVGVIALGAKMAKADGVVTMDEVNAFKEVFKVPDGEMKNVARVFNLAKQDVAGYEAYAEQLATMFKGNRKLLEDVLEGLFHIAKADEVLDPREEQYLAGVAKRFGMTTELGAYLDPLADKAMLMSIYVSLSIAGLLPLWVVIAVVSRDVMILGAIVVSWLVEQPLEIHPLLVSKLNTGAQFVLAALVLAMNAFGFDAGYAYPVALATVGVLTGLSAAAYLVAWMRHMAS